MTSSAVIRLHIGNAVPPANDADTDRVIALWQQIGHFFHRRPIVAQSGISGAAKPYLVTLDAGALLHVLDNAKRESHSLSGHQRAHVQDADKLIAAELAITLERPESADNLLEEPFSEEESHQVAMVFLQQLILAAHITRPGSIQILDARFVGEGAHRFEPQIFDARILYGALRAAVDHGWPVLRELPFEEVWTWLDGCEVSKNHTAITDINKALFTLLKVAQQRQEYSARTVLLVLYLLEVLLDCRHARSPVTVGSRIRLVLGEVAEFADCFGELYEVRNKLFVASQPVHRPPLICHDTAAALRGQIGQYHTSVESGTAAALALLQDLVAHGAYRYYFTETFSRK